MLDVFGCNLLGIYIGYILVNKFKMKKYDISDVHSEENKKDFLKYAWEFVVTDYYEPLELHNLTYF